MPSTWQRLNKSLFGCWENYTWQAAGQAPWVNLWEVLICVWLERLLRVGWRDPLPPLCILGTPEHLQYSSVLRAQRLLVCMTKSYMFHRWPDSSCALGLFSRKISPSTRDADLSAKPLHEVVGNLALFPTSAIAVSCPLGPPEICLLENVQVCFIQSTLFTFPLMQSLRAWAKYSWWFFPIPSSCVPSQHQ